VQHQRTRFFELAHQTIAPQHRFGNGGALIQIRGLRAGVGWLDHGVERFVAEERRVLLDDA
jgi:hypothetical protein